MKAGTTSQTRPGAFLAAACWRQVTTQSEERGEEEGQRQPKEGRVLHEKLASPPPLPCVLVQGRRGRRVGNWREGDVYAEQPGGRRGRGAVGAGSKSFG